jgi:hypothetical protein
MSRSRILKSYLRKNFQNHLEGSAGSQVESGESSFVYNDSPRRDFDLGGDWSDIGGDETHERTTSPSRHHHGAPKYVGMNDDSETSHRFLIEWKWENHDIENNIDHVDCDGLILTYNLPENVPILATGTILLKG